jgi:hypothetical protein
MCILTRLDRWRSGWCRIAKAPFVLSTTIELNEEIDKAVDEALALIERRKLKKAEKHLTQLLSEYPRYHMVQYGMGALYAVKGQISAAGGG